MVRALNKMTKAGMPESVRIACAVGCYRKGRLKSDLFNKATPRVNPVRTTAKSGTPILTRARPTDRFLKTQSISERRK